VSRRIGIEPGPEPDGGFVLGPFSTNVLSMTAAYAAVANGGYRVTPTGVLAVVDGRGQVRASFMEPARTRVIPERCIEPTRAVLNEVVRSGTGRGAALGRWKAYGKTGTTTGHADAWFIGWSEGRVLGVWMGKRRDASGEGLAGKGAPAEFFRRVSTSTNEMMDYRMAQARHKGGRPAAPVIAARPKRPDLAKGPERRSALGPITAQARRPDASQTNSRPRSPSPQVWDREPWPEEDEFPDR
jgi:penicillin-binding protein 1A